MIRWKYLAPRLTILGLVCLFYWFAMDPLLRRALIALGQSAVGARVELGDLRTSLIGTEIQLSDVCVADPHRPMENLFEFDDATLDLDASALMRRKLVVEDGSLLGLQIGSMRSESGALARKEPTKRRPWNIATPDFPLAWLENLAQTMQKKLEEDLDSVRLARQLAESWPAEYERIQGQAETLNGRIMQLRRLIENAGTASHDPVRAMRTVQQARIDLQQIQREMDQLRRAMADLGQQTLEDRQAIARAKEHDVRRIRDTLQPQRVTAADLSEYLLGAELIELVATLTDWIHWGRKYVPRKIDRPEPGRRRGTIVQFDRRTNEPDLLIRALRLQGTGRFRQQPFQFVGTATGITSQPDVYGRPTLLVARTTGSVEMLAQLYLDHTQQEARDRVTIECPRLGQVRRTLGNRDHLAVTVSPGDAGLWVLLDLHGDRLSGELLLRQSDVQLVSSLDARYRGSALGGALQTTLSQIDHLEARAVLTGTVQRPKLRLHCNLGDQLIQGLTLGWQKEVDARSQELVAEVDRRVDEQLSQAEQAVTTLKRQLAGQMARDRQQIEQLLQLAGIPPQFPQGTLPGQGVSERFRGSQGVGRQILDRNLPTDGLMR